MSTDWRDLGEGSCPPGDDEHPRYRHRGWLRTNGSAGVRFLFALFLDAFPIPGRNRPTF